ncbi:MAG: cobalamin biosynthesis protein CobD [Rhizobiales bacterium]|nr:cobalamin biosynthesis protein CobD [Hyphomicrobiales bacterium]
MIWPGPAFGAAALSLIIERFIGYPDKIYQQIGHPIEWIGWWIAWLERRLNNPDATFLQARLRGVLELALVLIPIFALTYPLGLVLREITGGWVIEAVIGTVFLAQKSLRDHVEAVAVALDHTLERGRLAVSRIVGRDPGMLDESGVSRAALESLAENASDGIVAPAFWFALAGLPGLVLYKAINTADSMIGHRSERYLHFGWAAARLDDLVNLPAARLCGALFAATAWTMNAQAARDAVDAMRRDADRHVSPNAGWPEAALAGALDIRLGGPRAYAGRTVDLPTMGRGRADLDRNDIRRGLKLYDRAMTLLAALAIILALIASR